MNITKINESSPPGLLDEVKLIKITNKHGMSVSLCNYGATLVSVVSADREGTFAEVVLGFPDVGAYPDDTNYLGATIGRFANRIANARFELNGKVFQLQPNDGLHVNHGGDFGFSKQLFQYEASGNKVVFFLYSYEGEGGFPGDLHCSVSYELTDEGELYIQYQARSNRQTVVSFTNHAYFNLSGTNADVFDHCLHIPSDEMLEMDKDYLPTGKIIPTGASTFRGQEILDVLGLKDGEVKGLNNYYLLKKESPADLVLAAVLSHALSGRRLQVYTDSPGVLLYTGDFLATAHPGHYGRTYGAYDGLCLECQHYPDAPNQKLAPTVILEKGAVYQQTIIYKFDTI